MIYQEEQQMIISGVMDIIKNDQYVQFIVIVGLTTFLITLFYYLYLSFGLKRFRAILTETQSEESIQKRIIVINENVINTKYVPKVIRNKWRNYYDEYNTNTSNVVPDPYDFYNHEDLVYKAGHRKVVETLPSIFVSLGILGTFWGITTGISDIDSQADVEGIQSGINTLLSGMKMAFYSSIAGIILSLLYQVSDRLFFYKLLTVSSDKLLLKIDQAIPIESKSSLLDKIASSQEEQLHDMRSFFTDEFLPLLTSGISEAVSKNLNPHLEKSNRIMEQVAENTLDAQSETLNDMVDHFIESLNEITGDHIKDLGAALHNTVEWQEKVHQEMSDLVAELTNVAEKQAEMAHNTTELSMKMNDYTKTLSEYQDKLSQTTHDLNNITEQNTGLLNEFRTTLSEMSDRHVREEEEFIQRIELMKETSAEISHMGQNIQALQEKTERTTLTLNDMSKRISEQLSNTQGLTETLANQHEISNQWSEKTQTLLEEIARSSSVSQTLLENLENLYDSITNERQKLDHMRSEYNETVLNSVQGLSDYWAENSQLMTDNKEQFSVLNKNLGYSMESFADHMHRGIQNTFDQFDSELKKAIEYLARAVNNIQTVVDSTEINMDEVNSNMERFNHTLNQMVAQEQT